MHLDVTTRQIRLSGADEALIHKKARNLQRFYGRITSCRVVVVGPPGNGGLLSVRIDLTVPGGELAITQQKGQLLAPTVRRAFAAARRRLEEYAQRRRGEVKSREVEPPAAVD